MSIDQLEAVTSCFRADLFNGKVVLVSGASSGIGLELARGFARLGGEVIATGSNAGKLKAAASHPANKGLRFEHLDVRDTTPSAPSPPRFRRSTFSSTPPALAVARRNTPKRSSSR